MAAKDNWPPVSNANSLKNHLGMKKKFCVLFHRRMETFFRKRIIMDDGVAQITDNQSLIGHRALCR